MPSSHGELTVQLETRTFWQQSMSETVAVGVDLEIVDGEIIDAGGEQPEMAAFQDGEVAQQDVAAILEGDGLVANSGLLGNEGVAEGVGAAAIR